MFAIFLQEVVAKVAHMTVEAFVLSGSLRRGGVGTVCPRAGHIFSSHFLVLGEFCQVASEG